MSPHMRHLAPAGSDKPIQSARTAGQYPGRRQDPPKGSRHGQLLESPVPRRLRKGPPPASAPLGCGASGGRRGRAIRCPPFHEGRARLDLAAGETLNVGACGATPGPVSRIRVCADAIPHGNARGVPVPMMLVTAPFDGAGGPAEVPSPFS